MPASPYLRRTCIAIASAAIISLCLAGCKEEEKQTTAQPSSNITSETFTREIQPRNPDKDNGEKQRILKRDGQGRLREIQIDFKGGHRGWIYKNQQGQIDSVKIVMSDGQIREGKPGVNRAVGEGKMTAPDGKVIMRMQPTGQDGVRSVIYSEDGVSEQFYEIIEGDTRTDVVLTKEGTKAFEITHGKTGLKTSLKLFDGSTLAYEENSARPDAVFGGLNYFEGTVYGADGKPTHRLKFREGPFDNEIGRVDQVEELASDGSVAKTISGDALPTVNLGPMVESMEKLRAAKKGVFENVNNGRRYLLVLEQDLSLLLQDKTK
jgi:hypothetical protein